jgi:hypothetical protein
MQYEITNNYSLPEKVVGFARQAIESRAHTFREVLGEIRINKANEQDHPECTKLHCDVVPLNSKDSKHRLVIIFNNTTGEVVKVKVGLLLVGSTTITF